MSVDAERVLFNLKIPACSWLVLWKVREENFQGWCGGWYVGGFDNSDFESTDNNLNSVDFKYLGGKFPNFRGGEGGF